MAHRPRLISRRAEPLAGDPPPLVNAHMRCAQDPFDARRNPGGHLNFGTAENMLIGREMLAWIEELAAGALRESDLHYHDPAGSPALRQAYVDFQAAVQGLPACDPSLVVCASGCSAILEALAFCLLEPGDEVLAIAPLYNGFFHDFGARFGVPLRLAHALSGDRVDFGRIDAAIASGPPPRAMLICNPHNPSGACLHPDDLRGLLTRAARHGMPVISDEIYAGSVHGDAEFVSCVDPRFDDIGWRQQVHRLWGLAKDFGLSGFKLGFCAAGNAQLARVLGQCAYFHTVSMQTQRLATRMLADHAGCRRMLELSRERLAAAHGRLCAGLARLGIGFRPAQAGVFTLADLGGWLGLRDDEEALRGWLLDTLRVNLAPGSLFACLEPGWFRICWARPTAELDALLERLASAPERIRRAPPGTDRV